VHGGIKALLFDLDGTLYVNNDLGRETDLSACRYLAGIKGITVEAAGSIIMETRQRLSAASGLTATLSQACLELGLDLADLHRHFAAEVQPERYLTMDERVVELLKALGNRFDLHLYTNNNRVLADRTMELLGVAGFFRQIFSIEYTWRPKPDQATLEMILRVIGREPAECLFIGDRYDVDLRLPAATGAAVFLVNSVQELFNLYMLTVGEDE